MEAKSAENFHKQLVQNEITLENFFTDSLYSTILYLYPKKTKLESVVSQNGSVGMEKTESAMSVGGEEKLWGQEKMERSSLKDDLSERHSRSHSHHRSQRDSRVHVLVLIIERLGAAHVTTLIMIPGAVRILTPIEIPEVSLITTLIEIREVILLMLNSLLLSIGFTMDVSLASWTTAYLWNFAISLLAERASFTSATLPAIVLVIHEMCFIATSRSKSKSPRSLGIESLST